MKKFFRPKNVAIIGASEKEGKIGCTLMKNLLETNVRIFPINPKRDQVFGLDCFSDASEIEEDVDLAILAIPADFVVEAVNKCVEKENPIRNIIIISAGFSEAGAEGEAREREIGKIVEEKGVRILGPNCLGVINLQAGLNLSFAQNSSSLAKGKVGLISQSGALVTALLDIAEEENFGFSLVSTLGNKIDVDESDLLDFYIKEEMVSAVVIYLEEVKNGEKFRKAMAEATKEKPVIVVHAGSSENAQKAMQSHTGAMASSFFVLKEAVEEAGGIFCENISSVVGLLKIIENESMPSGQDLSNEVLIITNAGGPGVIAIDALAESKNIDAYGLSDRAKIALAEKLPRACSLANPLDVLGDATEERYEIVLDVLSKEEKKPGAVVALITPQEGTPVIEIIKVLENRDFGFPVIPCLIAGKTFSLVSKMLENSSLAMFKFPKEAIGSLDLFFQRIKKSEVVKNSQKEGTQQEKEGESGQILDYFKTLEIAKEFEINLVSAKEIDDEFLSSESGFDEISFPVVAKVEGGEIFHKNVLGGVVLGIKNKEELKEAAFRLRNNFPEGRIIIQKQVEAGQEFIIGAKRDPVFGLVIVAGIGGVATEIVNEKLIFLSPLDKDKIASKLVGSKLEKVLKKQRINEESFAREVEKLYQLSSKNPQFKEIDINPMIFYPDKEPVAVDMKLVS